MNKFEQPPKFLAESHDNEHHLQEWPSESRPDGKPCNYLHLLPELEATLVVVQRSSHQEAQHQPQQQVSQRQIFDALFIL